MDKIVTSDATIRHAYKTVYRLPENGMRPIHRKYGLWICKFNRRHEAEPVSPDISPMRHFEFYDISHMYDGHGWYQTEEDGRILEVEKGEGVITSPGFRHRYGGLNAPYCEDAIAFCGPVADCLFNAGVIKNGILKIGEGRRLLPIIELALDNSEDSQIKANIELQRLLVDLHFENKSLEIRDNPAFDRLLSEMRAAPEKNWSLELMTDYCKLSVSQLNRLFKRRTSMTSKAYLDGLRMQLAAEMLAGDDRSVKEISVELGYHDPYHFSRRFKELKGHSPQNYRELSKG